MLKGFNRVKVSVIMLDKTMRRVVLDIFTISTLIAGSRFTGGQ